MTEFQAELLLSATYYFTMFFPKIKILLQPVS